MILSALAAFLFTSPIHPRVHIEWRPNRVDVELRAIAGLESSFGKKQRHKPNSRGPFHTAYGPFGLKASTAHLEYMRSQSLRRMYPGLGDRTSFFNAFITNPNVYYACANAHWGWLRRNTATIEQAVYAWRWGFGASKKTTADKMLMDGYVVKYITMFKKDQGPTNVVAAAW